MDIFQCHTLSTLQRVFNSWPNELSVNTEHGTVIMFYVQMNDIETARISEHFYDTSQWINDAFNQNEAKVLVTCWQGASR